MSGINGHLHCIYHSCLDLVHFVPISDCQMSKTGAGNLKLHNKRFCSGGGGHSVLLQFFSSSLKSQPLIVVMTSLSGKSAYILKVLRICQKPNG